MDYDKLEKDYYENISGERPTDERLSHFCFDIRLECKKCIFSVGNNLCRKVFEDSRKEILINWDKKRSEVKNG